MHNLPENLFANPVWNALQSTHRHFAVRAGDACRYPAEVAPFGAVAEASLDALRQLHSLLDPGESVWVADVGIENFFRDTAKDSLEISRERSLELSLEQSLDCLQMILPADVAMPDSVSDQGLGKSGDPEMKIVPLSRENAAEMVALTDVAFPGFFRARTCEMGSYYGIREGGKLIAMAGERLKLDGYSELSGVCTHPEYRGKGLAARLMWQLVRDHRRDGIVSWLHVGSENRRAVELYERMGFSVVRHVLLVRLKRAG